MALFEVCLRVKLTNIHDSSTVCFSHSWLIVTGTQRRCVEPSVPLRPVTTIRRHPMFVFFFYQTMVTLSLHPHPLFTSKLLGKRAYRLFHHLRMFEIPSRCDCQFRASRCQILWECLGPCIVWSLFEDARATARHHFVDETNTSGCITCKHRNAQHLAISSMFQGGAPTGLSRKCGERAHLFWFCTKVGRNRHGSSNIQQNNCQDFKV